MQSLVTAAAGGILIALVAIGRAVHLRAMGVVAVATLALSGPFFAANLGLATPSDLPSLVAVLGALLLELKRPQRGCAPLALLAVAGLWRPEVWLVSLAYGLYCAPGRTWSGRVRLAMLVVSAPVVWMASDLVLTGNALYSFTYTQWRTAVSARPTGLALVPAVLSSTLTGSFSVPVLLGAGAGLTLDLWLGVLPRVIPVLLGLNVIAFAAVGAAAMPVISRYTVPTVVLIALYFGFFICGWRGAVNAWVKRVWAVAAATLIVAALATLPSQISALSRDGNWLDAQGHFDRGLSKLVGDASARKVISHCGPVQTSFQVVPLLAYALDRNPRAIATVNARIPQTGTVVEPARRQSLFDTPSHYMASAYIQRGFRLVRAGDGWLVFTRCAPRPGALPTHRRGPRAPDRSGG
jgi:hypothetical protein